MSLVQSIFGSVSSGDGPTSTLFDAAVVEESKLVKKKPSKKKQEKAKQDDDDDASSSSSSSSSASDEKEKKDDKKSSETKKTASPPAVQQQSAAPTKPTKPKPSPQDEEERTVFVGNLPLSATRKTLAKLFSECGKIVSTRLRSVAVAGIKVPQNRAGDQNLVKKVCTNIKQLDVDAKSSIQGYVVFVDKESVDKALELNNKPLQDDHPDATRAVRRIRVDRATPTMDPKRSVFVGNLPYQADEATLQDCFVQGCDLTPDDIVGVRVIRDSATYQCKGFGYVLFQDSTMVATALQTMNDVEYMKRPLRVKVCGKSLKGRRGEPKNRKRNLVANNDDATNNNNGGSGGGSPQKKQRTSTTPSAAGGQPQPPVQSGAMKRVARKEKSKTNKRKRGEKKKGAPGKAASSGKSKRAVVDAKVEKRVKKLRKRAANGMGKNRK